MASRETLDKFADSVDGHELPAWMFSAPIQTHRKSRAKRNLAWEQIELQSHGFYAQNLHDLALRFPVLTPMELRISVLIKGMLTNSDIADVLNINVKTVENHRVNIRYKLRLKKKQNLLNYLLTIS